MSELSLDGIKGRWTDDISEDWAVHVAELVGKL